MSSEEKSLKFYLPEDAITNILSRLPVKTLLRFKCVCTKWRTLISSPYFTELHLNCSNSNPLRQCILVHIPQGHKLIPFDPVTFSPYTYFNVGLDQACSFGHDMRFVGSINGLLCLCESLGKWVCLWNPSTRMFRKINIQPHITNFYSIGFGLDLIANDYKVVLVVNLRNEKGLARTVLNVWSTNLESWREIKVDSNFIPRSFICDVVVKEFAYWIVNDGPVSLVASLNMSTEELQLVPVPDVYPKNNNDTFYGVIWKENFALAAFDSSGAYQVWTMENDTVQKEHWSKKFTFQFRRSLQGFYRINFGNGKLLYNRGDRELILYDLETGIRQTANTIKYDYSAGGAHYYVESLISVKGFKPIVQNGKMKTRKRMFDY